MNAPFDPKKLSKDQVESNSRIVSDLIFEAQVALEELAGAAIQAFSSCEETEDVFTDEKLKGLLIICESLANDAVSKINQAIPLCQTDLAKHHQKALAILTTIEEMLDLRIARKYTEALLSGLFKVTEKFNGELEELQKTI
ncbi:MAG: hypothetical protein LKF82_07240 [Acinetobacter populi]|jgi:hypothetical protein|uniref:hypothetical protein n=1 Tax=Acinetobacter populi TaxID=1582270 RepID=UPI002355A2AF|nr:hypothetical protein [Acinetobacter populi]MCH4247620.1 hypothetical protein [Acinetobacter populi]